MNTWYSPVLITRFKVTDKVSVSTRAEYYSDKKGVIIPTSTTNGFKTLGLSANVDYAIQENAVWRIEARTLKSRDKIFEKRNNTFTSTSTWLITSIAISF
jgi:hypothetical protein